MYAGYKLKRHKAYRHRGLYLLVVLVLITITAGSIVALFVRGFKLNDIEKQLFAQNLNTPTIKVWLIESPGFETKMEAYKVGLGANETGLGVYVLNKENQWHWLAGVYTTLQDAENVINRYPSTKNLIVREYEVKSKKFKISPEAAQPCREVFESVLKIFNLLLELRKTITDNVINQDLILNLTNEYNAIKTKVEELQTINMEIKSPLIASVIYTANQNILSLQEIVCGNNSFRLATVNTILLKTIFSLDNF